MNRLISRKNIFVVLALSAILLLTNLSVLSQQYSPWSMAENLGPAINTTALEGCPFISKDNMSLFFASDRQGGPPDIYVSNRERGDLSWGTPINLGAILNSPSGEVCPTLTIDEHHLFFVSNRPGGCGGDDIYVSRRRDKSDPTGWETPVNLGCQFNSPQGDVTPSLFSDENGTTYLFFSSNRIAAQGMDIYVSILQPDGKFGVPVPVAELNTPFNDMRPNIRYRDGLEIFFESNRNDPAAPNDLFGSLRETTSSAWSMPQSLGPLVNSPFLEGRPSLSFDGTELYFMSNRQGGSPDIYVTRRSKLTGPR